MPKLHNPDCEFATGCACPEGEIETLVFIKGSAAHRFHMNAEKVIRILEHALQRIAYLTEDWPSKTAAAALTEAAIAANRRT